MKYIHVNQHKIRSNMKNRKKEDFVEEPVITVKEGKKNTYCYEVAIDGPSTVLYGGVDKPLLSCGARVVIKTDADVKILR